MSTPPETDPHARMLSELLEGLVAPAALARAGAVRVTGLCDDSRRAAPGAVFFAIAGAHDDGRRHIADAVSRGAAAIVSETDHADAGAPVARVDNARAVLARAAARWHGLDGPDCGGLKLAGVTGTNGKSTTAFMTRAILNAAGMRCALLGTVYYDLCGRNVSAAMTTPGPIELAALLREARNNGAIAAAIEVSSHALDQHRTDGLRFAAAAFTNLTGDHLDYHGTIDAYRAAKRRLFESLDAEGVAVLNADDPAHAAMAEGCRGRVVTYAVDRDADLRATLSGGTISGTVYRLCAEGREFALENALIGRHNVYNALAAAGLARACGAAWEAVAAGLTALRNVPGRLQRVPCGSPADIFVDYAHSDDALRNVLSVVKPLTRGRLTVVFGCGGDRDRSKRPRMARAAADLADRVVVTSDNPRSEDPRAIVDEVLTGLRPEDLPRVRVEVDRAAAIRLAIGAAEAGDVVVIAGKGHENYQVIGATRVHFDDVEAAIAAAAALRRAGAEGGGSA